MSSRPEPRMAKQELLKLLREDDFRGHTVFRQLDAMLKLQWLSEAAAFALQARRARRAAKPR